MKKIILTLLILGGGGFFVVYASDYPSSIPSTDFLIEQSTGTKEKNVEYDTILSSKDKWWDDLKPRLEDGWELTSLIYSQTDDSVIIIVERPIKGEKNNSNYNSSDCSSRYFVSSTPPAKGNFNYEKVDAWYESREYKYHIVGDKIVDVIKK